MDRGTAWALIEAARVATLGTIRADGRPHLVPCVFAPADPLIYIPVDAKPKRSRKLLRLANLEANPNAGILAQSWDEDWSRLWWVRLDGRARPLRSLAEMQTPRRLLLARYSQYTDPSELNPIIAVDVDSWTAWSATDRGSS
jgi:PPOX class probable F420-dependent enzyme